MMQDNIHSGIDGSSDSGLQVRDIQFSGPTYQVQVYDPQYNSGEELWVFVQLDESGNMRDAFCSCEEEAVAVRCVHINAAIQTIFKGHLLPLHERYSRSLWHKLCFFTGERLDFNSFDLNKVSKGNYEYSIENKKFFYVKGLNNDARKIITQLIEERTTETEETSLKFSNLPSKELILWREGRPSLQLQYELSFWSDLGKKLMLLQEQGEEYQILFSFSDTKIPNWIQVNFANLELGFSLQEEWLAEIIPTLAKVKSPLPVHNLEEEGVSKITYDKITSSMLLEGKEEEEKREGIAFGDWLYLEGKGFYATKRQGLLADSVLEGEKITELLNEYGNLLQKTLYKSKLYPDPFPISYSLFFDEKNDLHIVGYVRKPGDLNFSGSHRFGKWVYIEDDGFYRLEGMRFPEIETIIARQHVSDFVTQHQAWLDTIAGFHIHNIIIESQLTYQLDDDHVLHFESHLTIADDENIIDLGQWVYIPNRGFYQKGTLSSELSLHHSLSVEPEDISLFIKMNSQELAYVPHFFTTKCPIEKTALKIFLDEFEVIQINPEYLPKKEFQNVHLSFFGDFVYIPDEGFSEIPVDLNLPERFREPVEIESENQEKFIQYELDHLKDFISEIDTRLVKPQTFQLAANHVEKKEGVLVGMFSLKLFYQSELGEVEVIALWKAWRQGKRYIFSKAGLLDLKEDRFIWLRQLHDKKIDKREQTVKLSNLDLFRLNAYDSIEPSLEHSKSAEIAQNLLKEITEFHVPVKPDLTGMHVQLRPYQQIGVEWLWSLYYHRLSGLLCDDMGLGKTLQAMALIAAAINYAKLQPEQRKLHFLVVCPTSVIYHWQDKLSKFFPSLRICTFYGSNRSFEEFHHDYDLLLTSYGIWRIETDLLSQVPFEIAILDEIQLAKNQSSKLHTSLLQIQAKMRLGMTGTPIENRLRELKSLFDIALPTYMLNEKEYREFFVRPIEKENNKKRQQLLSRYIKPFVLRRKKGDVLQDLPEKTEEIAYCPLLPEQQRLYQEVLQRARDQILGELQDEQTALPYLHIFALLSRLKQICDHPAVYYQDPSQYTKYQSGKWNLFVELLHEARDSGHKVVVFSQYLAQLDIIEIYLQENNIGFARLRGATVKRGEEVKRFQEDPSCEVFVASLQAGGLGIDLTAGSKVIHIDRWWNAARENQATDRVHRIGQTRGVQVFKLVTRGTFEEKIDTMIMKKGKLMEETVGTDDHDAIKKLDRNEILELLADVRMGQEDQQEIISDDESK